MIYLNLAIVLSRLRQKPETVCGNLRHEPTLQDVRILQPGNGKEYGANFLYLTTWERIESETDLPGCLVCVGGGEKARAFCERCGTAALFYEPDTDPIELFTELQEIFAAFHELHNSFRTYLIAHYSIYDIISTCARFFENYTLLLDSNGNILEASTEFLADGSDEAMKKKAGDALAEKLVASILRWEKQNHTALPQQIRHAAAEEDVPEYFVASFFDGNRCFGMLAICGGDRPLNPEAETLLRYVCNLLAPCLMGRYSPSVKVNSFIRSSINSLLDNATVNNSALISSLNSIGWNVKDEYRIVYIRMVYGSERNIRGTLSDYYRYENIFPDCIAVKDFSCVVIMVHNADKEVILNSLEDLRKLMTSHRMNCCISLPFGDFFNLRQHFELTRSALNIGGLQDNVIFYRDVMPKHIVSEMSASFHIEALCHVAAVRVWEHDRQNGTNLLLALEKYLLNNRSLQDAATQLYIHRNTMNYRLKSILKITDLPLDSPEERLHLLMSCIMLRYHDEDQHAD